MKRVQIVGMIKWKIIINDLFETKIKLNQFLPILLNVSIYLRK